jgi:hypothetical protein
MPSFSLEGSVPRVDFQMIVAGNNVELKLSLGGRFKDTLINFDLKSK